MTLYRFYPVFSISTNLFEVLGLVKPSFLVKNLVLINFLMVSRYYSGIWEELKYYLLQLLSFIGETQSKLVLQEPYLNSVKSGVWSVLFLPLSTELSITLSIGSHSFSAVVQAPNTALHYVVFLTMITGVVCNIDCLPLRVWGAKVLPEKYSSYPVFEHPQW